MPTRGYAYHCLAKPVNAKKPKKILTYIDHHQPPPSPSTPSNRGSTSLRCVVVNAVWEFMARPFVLFAQEIILNLSTLGIQRFKDSMYSEIAKGRYDRASLQMMGLYVSLFVSCLLVLPFVFFFCLEKA